MVFVARASRPCVSRASLRQAQGRLCPRFEGQGPQTRSIASGNPRYPRHERARVPCLRLVDMPDSRGQTCLRKAVGMAPGSQTRFLAFGDPPPSHYRTWSSRRIRQNGWGAAPFVVARKGIDSSSQGERPRSPKDIVRGRTTSEENPWRRHYKRGREKSRARAPGSPWTCWLAYWASGV